MYVNAALHPIALVIRLAPCTGDLDCSVDVCARRGAPGVLVTSALKPRSARPGRHSGRDQPVAPYSGAGAAFCGCAHLVERAGRWRAPGMTGLRRRRAIVSANVRNVVESSLDRLRRADEALGPDPAAFEPRLNAAGEGITVLYDAAGLTIPREGARGASVGDNAEFRALATGEPWTVTPLLGPGGRAALLRRGAPAGAQRAVCRRDDRPSAGRTALGSLGRGGARGLNPPLASCAMMAGW